MLRRRMSPSVARERPFHQAAPGYLEYEPATGKFTYRGNRQWCSPSLTVPCICREGSISRQSCGKGKTFTFMSSWSQKTKILSSSFL
jgi:hypothetical protein